MTDLSLPRFVFVIDTDSYSGNFERQLCAFCTGQIGDCGVGDDTAGEFETKFPILFKEFEDIVGTMPDEHGCSRPATLWPTRGRFCTGFGGTWNEGDDPNEVNHAHIAAAHEFFDKRIAEAEAKVAAGDARWQPSLDNDHKRLSQAEWEMPPHLPVYESVGIYFNERPTPEQIAFMKGRALTYAKNPTDLGYHGPFRIKGFALVEVEVKQTRAEL